MMTEQELNNLIRGKAQNADDRRNRARQTPDRLQNGPLDLTRGSKQTRPVDVR